MRGLRMAMEQLKAGGCRTIYINGSFVTIKPDPGDFDACWDSEDVDYDYLRKNAPRLLNHLDRSAQKSKYSTFQVSEVHNRGRDTAVPCPYGNRRAIGVYFINMESAV